MKTHKKQSGFILIEIAIVLVIIGLLIGGILKGQEVIQNAKYKRFISDKNAISAAIYSYQDRYRALPGDHRTARNVLPGSRNGNGNGRIDGTFNVTTGTGESRLFWQHLRRAGFIEDNAANQLQQPNHAFGGIMGVQRNRYGLNQTLLCHSEINGKDAQIIDIQNDDGRPNSGSIRAGLNTSNTVATSYVTTGSNVYTVCLTL